MDRGGGGGLIGVGAPGGAQGEALARDRTARGAGRVSVGTIAGEGAIAVGEGEAWRVTPPRVEVVSAVGAGDSFLAELLGALAARAPLSEALARAMAAAASAVTTPATELVDPVLAEELRAAMSLTRLEKPS